jgi:ubiquinone/menaquinone biosynthesis C-methylase UbiE
VDGQAVYQWNRSVYNRAEVAEDYAGRFVELGLLGAEAAILARIRDQVRGQPVLDIGVGGGRTVRHLSPNSGRYVGIDYAQEMVRCCRRRFPGLEFHHCDGIDMRIFEDHTFALAWFSYNGIDYAYPEDRARIIREVYRVLRPGGLFVFSSHNLRARPQRPRLLPLLVLDPNPWRMARVNLSSLKRYLTSVYYYRRNKPHELHGPGFAVRVDMAHEYRLLTFHASMAYQVEQLEAMGFEGIEMVGLDGSPLARDEDTEDGWIYYVARKPALR